MKLEQHSSLVLDALAVGFSGCIALTAMLSAAVADTCEGRGCQTALSEHRLACLGVGSCAAICTATINEASMPGVHDYFVTDPPVLNGSCAVTWTIPTGLANASDTFTCFTFPN